MKDILKNLFENEGPRTGYATVTARISASKYQLQQSGRTIFAESADFYPPGTEVIIRDGAIIGPGKRTGKPKTYEV